MTSKTQIQQVYGEAQLPIHKTLLMERDYTHFCDAEANIRLREVCIQHLFLSLLLEAR